MVLESLNRRDTFLILKHVLDQQRKIDLQVGNVINSITIGYHFEKDDPRFFHLKTVLEEFFDTVRNPGLVLLENGKTREY